MRMGDITRLVEEECVPAQPLRKQSIRRLPLVFEQYFLDGLPVDRQRKRLANCRSDAIVIENECERVDKCALPIARLGDIRPAQAEIECLILQIAAHLDFDRVQERSATRIVVISDKSGSFARLK